MRGSEKVEESKMNRKKEYEGMGRGWRKVEKKRKEWFG